MTARYGTVVVNIHQLADLVPEGRTVVAIADEVERWGSGSTTRRVLVLDDGATVAWSDVEQVLQAGRRNLRH